MAITARFAVIGLLCGCASAPVPAPTLARIHPDARPLVDAWAAAIGGRDRLAKADAIHVRATYAKGGLIGTLDRWETARGERREDIQLAFLRELDVFDGMRGWLVDRNREVRDLAGFELDDQLALAYFGAAAALLPDRRAGEVTTNAAGALVLAPQGGHRTITVTLDPATHLPATLVRRDSEHLKTMRLSDWRAVDGVLVPFTIHEDNDDPNDAVTIHVQSAEHAAPPPGTFARPADRESDAQIAGTVTVPIELVLGGLIFVKVAINGVPMSFVLDTGAESTVLNASRLSKLGLVATGTFAAGAAGGDVIVSYVPHVTTQVGDAKVLDQIVSTTPLDSLEGPIARPLDGILGYDFVSRFVVEIDYAGHVMRLHDRATFHHDRGSSVAISLEGSTPFIDASITVANLAPLPGHFTLDTGCLCEVQLGAPFTDVHKLLDAVPEAKEVGFSAGAGGATHQVSATIDALQIGGNVIAKPTADFSRDTTGAESDPESAGLIGSLVWRRFVLVLDYKHGQIWLDPSTKQ